MSAVVDVAVAAALFSIPLGIVAAVLYGRAALRELRAIGAAVDAGTRSGEECCRDLYGLAFETGADVAAIRGAVEEREGASSE